VPITRTARNTEKKAVRSVQKMAAAAAAAWEERERERERERSRREVVARDGH
jgi:hypothetical protein